MFPASHKPNEDAARIGGAVGGIRPRRLLLVGLGNIGSYLATLATIQFHVFLQVVLHRISSRLGAI